MRNKKSPFFGTLSHKKGKLTAPGPDPGQGWAALIVSDGKYSCKTKNGFYQFRPGVRVGENHLFFIFLLLTIHIL